MQLFSVFENPFPYGTVYLYNHIIQVEKMEKINKQREEQ